MTRQQIDHYWGEVRICASNMLSCLPPDYDFDFDYVRSEFAWYEDDTGHSIGYQDENTDEWVCLSEEDVYGIMRWLRGDFDEEEINTDGDEGHITAKIDS